MMGGCDVEDDDQYIEDTIFRMFQIDLPCENFGNFFFFTCAIRDSVNVLTLFKLRLLVLNRVTAFAVIFSASDV